MKGLYDKYIIRKANGKPLAEDFYAIVLRVDGGRYVDACRAGVAAFAEAVRKDNPRLAFDIRFMLDGYVEEKEYWGLAGLQEPFSEELVDRILSLKDEQGKDMLAVLADDQKVPETLDCEDCPCPEDKECWECYVYEGFQKAVKAGFRRVV